MKSVHDIDLSRVAVVGPSGSGKTTLARALAELLGQPFVELDAIHWQPDWQPLDAKAMRLQVQPHVSGDRWVVDGNYNTKLADLVLGRATTVIWLDLPMWIFFPRLLKRTAFWAVNMWVLWMFCSSSSDLRRAAWMSSSTGGGLSKPSKRSAASLKYWIDL